MVEDFRRKEGPRDPAVHPFEPDGLVQIAFIPVPAVPVPHPGLPDMELRTIRN